MNYHQPPTQSPIPSPESPNSSACSKRSLVLLNEMGDVEISWDSDQDEAMRAVIEKKMAEGVKFFQVTTKGIFARRKRLKNLDDLQRCRIQVADGDIEKLFMQGKVEFHRRETGEDMHITRIVDPALAAQTNTVATRQFQGG